RRTGDHHGYRTAICPHPRLGRRPATREPSGGAHGAYAAAARRTLERSAAAAADDGRGAALGRTAGALAHLRDAAAAQGPERRDAPRRVPPQRERPAPLAHAGCRRPRERRRGALPGPEAFAGEAGRGGRWGRGAGVVAGVGLSRSSPANAST